MYSYVATPADFGVADLMARQACVRGIWPPQSPCAVASCGRWCCNHNALGGHAFLIEATHRAFILPRRRAWPHASRPSHQSVHPELGSSQRRKKLRPIPCPERMVGVRTFRKPSLRWATPDAWERYIHSPPPFLGHPTASGAGGGGDGIGGAGAAGGGVDLPQPLSKGGCRNSSSRRLDLNRGLHLFVYQRRAAWGVRGKGKRGATRQGFHQTRDGLQPNLRCEQHRSPIGRPPGSLNNWLRLAPAVWPPSQTGPVAGSTPAPVSLWGSGRRTAPSRPRLRPPTSMCLLPCAASCPCHKCAAFLAEQKRLAACPTLSAAPPKAARNVWCPPPDLVTGPSSACPACAGMAPPCCKAHSCTGSAYGLRSAPSTSLPTPQWFRASAGPPARPLQSSSLFA